MNSDYKSIETRGELEGRYANYFAIGYTEHELVIDFGQSYLENAPPELSVRIVTDPVYAKEFLSMLRDSIDAFESTYGSIRDESFVNSDEG